MKKRGILTFSIILLLALMPNTFPIYSESIYSGTVEDGDIINISGHIFEFKIDSISNKVYIEIDISGVIIANNECEIKDDFYICISDVSFSYRNYTDYYDVYKALVDVSQIKSKISITNTIGQNNILIGEETTAEMAVENTADVAAEDVTATINIPDSVLITDVGGCKKTLDKIVFREDVHPTQIRRCTYKVKGLAADNFELKANITYFNGIEQVSATSSTISGKVYPASLKISPKLDKSKFDIQEKLNLTIDIENINDQYDLTITTFNIKIPEKLLLLKRPRDTTGTNRLISWSGTLASKEKKSLVVQLQSQVTGNYSVPIGASYKISKFLRAVQTTSNIEVYCDCPYISHYFSQQIAVPDQRIGLKAFVANPSKIHNFRNVKINYITNIPNIQNFSTAYSSIKPSESIKIFDSSIITPSLDEIYYFNITVVYESSGNQIFVVKDKIIIKVPGGEEIKVEEQQEAEEKIEYAEQKEGVILGTEETKEEIPVTVIEDGEERPIKAYTIIAYIAGVIFILIVLIIFRRKQTEKRKEDIKELGSAEEKKQIIKESLLNIFKGIKEKIKRKPKINKKEEADYKELEKEIKELGTILEKEKRKK
jgi:hypothetical protein|tara:strand:- start:12347 stop:14146 length:1800 start_codon:yes stop_codon:yes gene_type:complete